MAPHWLKRGDIGRLPPPSISVSVAGCLSFVNFASYVKARSSVGERFLDTEEVGGSIPPVPTTDDARVSRRLAQ